MERVRKFITGEPAEEVEMRKLRFHNTGAGSFVIPGKIVPPGAKFEAYDKDVPKAFRDIIILLDPSPAKSAAPEVEALKPVYEIVPRGKSKSLFDIVDANGKKMNEAALSKELAETFLADLSK